MEPFNRFASQLVKRMVPTMVVVLGFSTFAQGENVTDRAFEARTLITSAQRVEYRTDILAPVKNAAFLLGERFKKGDHLIEMDCARYDAERKAAQASAHAAEIEYRTKKRLYKYQAAGKNEVDMAQAQSAEAKAHLAAQKAKSASCIFKAPFDGRVVELNVMPHEFPPSDRPMIVVINDQILQMELVVPSKWLVWLRKGSMFEVEIDETGSLGSGIVDRIGAEVDPVSQTVSLVAVFKDRPEAVLAGMSGTVHFVRNSN